MASQDGRPPSSQTDTTDMEEPEAPVTPTYDTSFFPKSASAPQMASSSRSLGDSNPDLPSALDRRNPTSGIPNIARMDIRDDRQPPSAPWTFGDFDLKSVQKDLPITGNVISATFTMPYKFGLSPKKDWEVSSRKGTSALFDSLSYLASDESPFDHTLVAWTGEIDAVPQRGEPGDGTTMKAVPLNKASAPIPVNAQVKPVLPNEVQDLYVDADDRRRLEKKIVQDHGGKVAPVWLPEDTDENDVMFLSNQGKWRRYGEHEIFTLFHYKQNEPTDGRAITESWKNYCRMNKAFADAIINAYKPGDIVVIHDYHLLLLPSLLRQRDPSMYIGFFLHIPFPSSEYFRCLTYRKNILEGVLGANMIGFQAFSHSRHFASCCTRILGFDSSPAGVDAFGAHVAVDVFPIGINAQKTLEYAFDSDDISQKIRNLRELYNGKKIIVGRDRLDSVRGVAQKLQAFEIFLERHPEWHDQVALIQVTSPTSIEDRDEKGDKTGRMISDLVARINGNFGSLSFTPVHYYPQYLSKAEYFALLRMADLGLITSVRDGMNTTALEYVICQRDNHGPLIISEFSGTASSLSDAIHINPWDLGGVAEAIESGLTMPQSIKEETQARSFHHVTTHTVQGWTEKYLQRLITNLASYDQTIATPSLDLTRLQSRYNTSGRRLFMFDYDGTLTPIVKDPQSAIPSDKVTRTLKGLAADPRNAVWIISGRDQAFLDEWMGDITELGLSAEHGSFMRMPGSTEWLNLTETFDMTWQAVVMDVFQQYTERTTGSFIERKKIALTWHYRRADPELGAFQARQCQAHLEDTVTKNFDVEVMSGKANLEVRPRFVNKGEIAKKLVRAYGAGEGKAPDFVLCLGDDFTDEDMFRALSASDLPHDHVFPVTVGASSKRTLARWHLLEPADVISALALIIGSQDAANSDLGTVAVGESGVLVGEGGARL